MRAIVATAFGTMVLSAWACDGASSDVSPVSPSRVPAAAAQAVAFAVADLSAPMDVPFPPRNDALQFRNALETKYRDGLRRSAVQTFVDQEGSVVWAQEYLRYRVNLCPHTEAVMRVMRQIDGQGVQPVCGTTATVIFPPRDEPLDFMVQLEAKYRDDLRRSSAPSFVDLEGGIVWTQEYLRYRVRGCSHGDAQQKVFDQIDGRGLQSECLAPFTGAWRGTVLSLACSGQGVLSQVCRTAPLVETMTLRLSQTGGAVAGTLEMTGHVTNMSGTVRGDRLEIRGQYTSQGITTTYHPWDTVLSGGTMAGRFVIVMSAPASGFAQYIMELFSVLRIAGDTDSPTEVAADTSAPNLAAALTRTSRAAWSRSRPD